MIRGEVGDRHLRGSEPLTATHSRRRPAPPARRPLGQFSQGDGAVHIPRRPSMYGTVRSRILMSLHSDQ